MNYVFLLNSYTISNYSYIVDNINEYCIKHEMDYTIEINSKENNTENILKKYDKSKSIIIAVGGDGMINRVLNSIQNTSNILGFIPCGTGNDFYRSIKLQGTENITECDLIKVNDKYFINVACFGIDADIANDGISSKYRIFKKYKYIINLVKHFCTYKSREFSLEINGKLINDTFITVVVCNGMYYGRGFNIGPFSNINDGLIDVYLVNDVNKLKMLRLILSMINGKHEKYSDVLKYKVKDLIIKAKEPVRCNIDGEVLEDFFFDIKVLEKKQKIYYSQDMINYILKRH